MSFKARAICIWAAEFLLYDITLRFGSFCGECRDGYEWMFTWVGNIMWLWWTLGWDVGYLRIHLAESLTGVTNNTCTFSVFYSSSSCKALFLFVVVC